MGFFHTSQSINLVLLISPEQIKPERCSCAQIEALEEGEKVICVDDAGDPSERDICGKPD